MFKLVVLRDSIRVEPSQLGPRNEALSDDTYLFKVVARQIRRKYCNKVLSQVGLCVTLFSIQWIGEGVVFPGMGATMFSSEFTLVVFMPRVGEIIYGTVLCSFKTGLVATSGFFQDIHIAPSSLPIPNALYVFVLVGLFGLLNVFSEMEIVLVLTLFLFSVQMVCGTGTMAAKS
jgi:DNA-directed RNA polymerase III subunit RPC8